ncbi:MAG: polysaccharide biosynthesis C-terminal domain-containing protein, partial [Bdellovibrionales bacterium]|nr:polysaccharide biosynthesis C-terminal domain-containing protein [Bdellovibrionales bacterium]
MYLAELECPSLRTYFHLRVASAAFATLISTALIFHVTDQITSHWIVAFLCAYKSIEFLRDIFFAELQRIKLLAHVAKSQITSSLLAIAGMLIVGFISRTTVAIVSAPMIASMSVMIFYDFRAYNGSQTDELSIYDRFQKSVKLLSGALPLGIMTLLISLNTSAPRLFLESYCSLREVGAFTAIGYLLVMITMFFSTLQIASLSRITAAFKKGPAQAKLLLLKLCALPLVTGLFIQFLTLWKGEELLSLVYGQSFENMRSIMQILLIAGITMPMFGFISTTLTVLRKNRIQAVISGLGTAACVLCCWLLVPKYGTTGAAIAVVSSSV